MGHRDSCSGIIRGISEDKIAGNIFRHVYFIYNLNTPALANITCIRK
jgi:hypothetical protein